MSGVPTALTEAEYRSVTDAAYGGRVPHDHDPLPFAVERIKADAYAAGLAARVSTATGVTEGEQ